MWAGHSWLLTRWWEAKTRTLEGLSLFYGLCFTCIAVPSAPAGYEVQQATLKEPCMEPESSPIAFWNPAEGQGARCWYLCVTEGSPNCAAYSVTYSLSWHTSAWSSSCSAIIWQSYSTWWVDTIFKEFKLSREFCGFFFSCVSKTFSYMEKTKTAIEVRKSSWYKNLCLSDKKKKIHEIILLFHPVSNLGIG